MKRDLEEQKRDIETANFLTMSKTLLEVFGHGMMKSAIKPLDAIRRSGGDDNTTNE